MRDKITRLEARLNKLSATSQNEIDNIKSEVESIKQQLQAPDVAAIEQQTMLLLTAPKPEPTPESVPAPEFKSTITETHQVIETAAVEITFDSMPLPDYSPSKPLAISTESTKSTGKTNKVEVIDEQEIAPVVRETTDTVPTKLAASAQPVYRHTKQKEQVQEQSKSLLKLFIASKLPMAGAVGKLHALYHEYQAQGKGTIFMLTMAGCLAMTFGFGYLLQFGFTQLLSDGGKMLSGYLLSAVVTMLGAFICLKKPKFEEYGSSIIGLGLIFANLTCYLSAIYLPSLSLGVTLSVAILIAFSSSALAMKFETKTVAVIGLVGGLLSPVVFGVDQLPGSWFGAYVLLTAIANVFLSNRIKWPILTQTTFVIATSVLAYTGLNNQPDIFMLVILTLFFLFFSYALTFEGLAIKSKITSSTMTLFSANAFYWLYAVLDGVYQQSLSPLTVAICMLVNTAIFAWIFHTLKLKGTKLGGLFYLAIAIFVGCAAFILLPEQASSIVWGLEGIALIVVGFNYRDRTVRLEGFAVFLLAIFGIISSLTESFFNQETTLALSWFYFICIAALSLALVQVYQRFSDHISPFEHTLHRIFDGLLTVLGAIGVFFAMFTINKEMTLLAAPVAMAWCFIRNYFFGSRAALAMTWVCLGLIVLQIVLSISAAQSLSFSKQSLVGQLARLEFVILGFGLKSIYQRWFSQYRDDYDFASTLRLMMFIWLPIAFLPRVIRTAPEYISVAIWLSTAISWLQFKKLQHWALGQQTLLLFIAGLAATAYTMMDFAVIHAVAGGTAALVFITAFILIEKLWQREHFNRHPLKSIAVISIMAVPWLLFSSVVQLSNSLTLAAIAVMGYFILVTYHGDKLAFVRARAVLTYRVGSVIGWSLLIIATISESNSLIWIFAIIASLAYLVAPYQLHSQSMDFIRSKLRRNVVSPLYKELNLATILAYIALSNILFGSPISVATTLLVLCHGIVLLYFSTIKGKTDLTKPATVLLAIAAGKLILLDMVSYGLLHKVIVFMGCGGMLLLAAWQFQKHKEKHIEV